jgi:predicted transposase/invertase (TIGR01784 family)
MNLSDIHNRYINFYTDFAFKKLFGTEINKELLISFLNALLKGQEEIKELSYLNGEQLGTSEADRRAVFDVYCTNERGERFIVEMQKGEQQFFKDRSVFYSTFPIREQAKKGDWDYKLQKVYTISIINFTFDNSNKEYYHHEVKLMDTQTKEVFFDKLVFIYLEMPKFKKEPSELTNIFEKWLYVIRNLANLNERPAELREKIFTHLFEAAEISQLTPEELVDYEDSLKVYRDLKNVISTAELKGEKKGLEEGLEKGRKEGRKEERAKANIEIGQIKEKVLQMARHLKSSGTPIEEIKALSGLTEEEINAL